MYTKYYGLTKKPFENTPDPDFLFLSKNHREVLASLTYAVNAAKGFVLVVGDIGTGKTTLIHALIKQLAPSFIVLNITNPRATFRDILHYLGQKVGVTSEKAGPLETVEAIRNKLETLHEGGGKHVALIVDEAHLLSDEALEDIRLISNIENEERKLIQIILVGQNELGDKLRKESLRPLKQRLVVTRRLVPLNRKETQEYILHRLRIAGKQPQLFDKKALSLIWKKSRGIPRLINQICDNAMLIGYAVEARSIGGKILKEVIGDMESVHKLKRNGPVLLSHRLRWISAVAITALLIVYLGIYIFDGKHFFLKNWIFRKDSDSVRTETPTQPQNSLVGQNRELVAKGSSSVETGVSSELTATNPLSNETEKLSVDTLHTSEKKQSAKANRLSGLEKQAPEGGKSSTAGQLQDRAERSNIFKPKQPPDNMDELSSDALNASEKKQSTAENKSSGPEQQLATSTKKSLTEEPQSGERGRNNGANLLQKPADFDGPAFSEITGDKSGDFKKLEGSNLRKVKPDECLYDLVRREYGIGNISIIDLIQMANPGIRNVNRVYPGQKIILPQFDRKDLIVKDKKGHYRIHYASFYRREDATLCIKNLIKKNQEAFVISAQQGDNLVYRVYVGTFKNSDDAGKILDTLELEFFSFLVK
jgi:general secretion pathway protein A